MRFFYVLSIILLMACQSKNDDPSKAQKMNTKLDLNLQAAEQLAELPLQCATQEYPNKLGQVIADSTDLKTPGQLHPAFYGCFDWHSAVHGHWSMVELLRLYPNLKQADSIKKVLKAHLSKANIEREVAYFKKDINQGYERMYGWAWLFRLSQSLYEWDDPLGTRLYGNLRPLTKLLEKKIDQFLPKLVYPIRVGEHTNTAFALNLIYDHAQSLDKTDLLEKIKNASLRFYKEDVACPLSWEPSGYDFLSPCLEEAVLMQKVLGEKDFDQWIDDFLPRLKNKDFTLKVAKVSDRSDGKLVHLDGLNFSRAWNLYQMSKEDDFSHLQPIARKHFNAAYPNLIGDSYEGGHWLASFAIYAYLPAMKFFKHIGPATLVTAAFIGPGTVSVCALAGIEHAYGLIWVMIISLIMTLFLQELTARLAIIDQLDLTELILSHLNRNKWISISIISLIFVAIVFGNTAYEAGNLSGVNIGLRILSFDDHFINLLGVKLNYAIIGITAIALLILHLRSYKRIEKILMLLVGVLSLSFIVLALLTTERLGVLIQGILQPKFPDKDPLIIAALIGTTVVPYNLFLHSALARQKWKSRKGIKSMRIDTFFAVALGILVSISIIITTANISDDLTNVNNLGTALEPVLGSFSAYLMGIGFIAAGLTSAITAPLAAAFVINKLFGLNYETRSFAFKRLSYVILIIGCLVAALDLEPVQVIKLAQVANAIILPVIVIIILWLDRQIGQQSKAGPFYQLLGLVVLLISVFLSLSSLYKLF